MFPPRAAPLPVPARHPLAGKDFAFKILRGASGIRTLELMLNATDIQNQLASLASDISRLRYEPANGRKVEIARFFEHQGSVVSFFKFIFGENDALTKTYEI
jgi:hypothetical protein